MFIALLNALFTAPAIMFYLSEKSIARHHARAAGFMVLQMYKTAIAKFV
jgi:hypothetical protein